MAIKIEEHNSIDELRKEVRHSTDGRYQLRLNSIILAKEKMPIKEILKKMLIGRTAYYRWVDAYNKGGMQALKNIQYSGQKDGNPKYDSKIFKEVFEKLDLMDEYWSVPKMQKLVLELHGVDVPYETMRMRVKRAGYSYKSNRPSHYKGDEAKQEEFKKMDSKV